MTIVEQEQRIGQYDGVVPQRLEAGVAPLDIVTLKDFLRFQVSVSEGLIDEEKRPTVDSIKTFEEWFFAAFTRITGNEHSDEDRKELYEVSSDRHQISSRSANFCSGLVRPWFKKI